MLPPETRPVAQAQQVQPVPALTARVIDRSATLDATQMQALEQKLAQARDIAQQDPKAVANIIKDWTSANAGG